MSRLLIAPSWLRNLKLVPSSRKWISLNLDIVFPTLLLAVVAIVFAILTTTKIANVISSPEFLQVVTAGRRGEVQRNYLERNEYLEYSPTLVRLNPGVAINVGKTDAAIIVTIENEELFPDLMMALHSMQAFKPSVAWEITELCVRTCPDKAIARVVVRGFKQEIH